MASNRNRGGIGGRLAAGVVFGLLVITADRSLAVAEQVNQVSHLYHFERPQLATNAGCVHLTVANCEQLHRVGEPAMPFLTARLLIPPGYSVQKTETVSPHDATLLPGNWRVEFAGQALARQGRGKGDLGPGLNRFIYNSDNPYPTSDAQLVSVQRMAGFDIALVRVFPVRYRPSSGRLEFNPEVNLRLTLAQAPTNSEPRIRPPSADQSSRRVAAFVDNPELLPSIQEQARETAPSVAAAAFDYLIITSSDLADAFKPLVDRKVADGLVVKVATVETITNQVAGIDAPEKIRNYIRQAYTNSGISYVLLGGNTAVVPCRYAFALAGLEPRDSYVPCDLYYSCLDGSWNGNGDRHWGDPTDGPDGGDVDLLSEVFVGRAPVATVQQVQTFVEKTVRYETESNPNVDRALLMATFLGEFPTGPCQGIDMFNPLLPILDRFTLSSLDDQGKSSPQWATREAIEQLNGSPHVVLYNGHGTPDILMRMHTWDLSRLSNSSPFLVCSVGCNAAQFDHGKFWPDSFGEALINGSSHGAFAAILNSRVGWFDPQYPWKYSGEFQARFFQEILVRGNRNLGVAHQRAKEDLIGSVETEGAMTYRWCYYEMTLLGDPHVPFDIPRNHLAAHAQAANESAAHTVAGGISPAQARPLEH